MANIAYFEVPADDLKRAEKFYHDLLAWEFIPTDVPGIPIEYGTITTGAAGDGTLNMGVYSSGRIRLPVSSPAHGLIRSIQFFRRGKNSKEGSSVRR